MIQIESVNESNSKDAYGFLNSVPSIKNIDEEILKNAVIVYDDSKVIGSISFEEYDSIGLIRYFVFKKNLSNSILFELLETLVINARKRELKTLVCVADNGEIKSLFEELGFSYLEKKIYINEEPIINSNHSNSHFLCMNIEK